MSEAFDVALLSRQFNIQPNPCAIEEDRAWVHLRTSVGRACTAEEFVKQLDGDAQARQSHLAPYLRARTTLREHQVAEGRNQRIGAYQRQAQSQAPTPRLCVEGPDSEAQAPNLTRELFDRGGKYAEKSPSPLPQGSAPPQDVEERSDDNSRREGRMTVNLASFSMPYRWVRLDVHCKATGDTADAVHARRRKRQWTDGVHCCIGPDGNLWVNPEEVNRWVEQGQVAAQSGHSSARSTAHAA